MLPLAILTVGGLLLYAGIHGYTITDVIGIALGRTPHKAPASSVFSPESQSPVTEESAAGSAMLGGGGLTQFDGHPVASWIVPILNWARQHGWTGRVTSGYRTPAEQEAAARAYGLEHYGPGGPLGSNHVGYIWPRGAVDVTNPQELAQVLHGYPGFPRLVWGGTTIEDAVHFSATGH